jgi:hypothetical protein
MNDGSLGRPLQRHKAMRDHLERLEQLDIEAIDD